MNYQDNDNYHNRHTYNYRPMPSKRILEARKRKRRKTLIIRRTIIIATAICIFSLIVFGFTTIIKSIINSQSKTPDTQDKIVSTTSKDTTLPQANEAVNSALTFNEPDIKAPSSTGRYAENTAMYILDNKILNLFYSSSASSKYYAETISEFKKSLGNSVTVYNMVAPTHPEFAIPKKLIENGIVDTSSQAENIKYIYSNYTADVVPINCYNALSKHCNEYIYFNTDHHWTGLGGYYAYTAFAEQTKQTPVNLSDCTENTIENFEGTLLSHAPDTPLDTVHFYTFPYENYAKMKQASVNDDFTETSIYYEAEPSGKNSYGVFIWGDNALFIEYNNSLNSNKKIAVVKDSYGNAVAPYLSANYDEVHVIDYRYFDMSLKDYCSQNGITEVLFINNVMTCNTASLIDQIKTIL